MSPAPDGHGATILRPAKQADAEAVWRLLKPSQHELTGMTALPGSLDAASELCAATATTTAELATGSFKLGDGASARILFVAVDRPPSSSGRPETALGVTGVTFKQAVPNLVVHVTTAGDGRGLVMRSISAPWTRTELDSSFLGPEARGRRLGTLLSRGRFMLLQIVGRQIPGTVAAHLRGTFDGDGSAPFWRHFGLHFAPQWPTSTEAESALDADPTRLADLANLIRPVEAAVLDSLGAVNAASLPAFHLLTAEGLQPNGMYDPIDGGPTLIAEIGDLSSATKRTHGRAIIEPFVANAGIVDGLVSVAAVDRFRVVRAPYRLAGDARIVIEPATAAALNAEADTLLAVNPLAPHRDRASRDRANRDRQPEMP